MTAGSWPERPFPDPDDGAIGPADFEDEGIPAAADADADEQGLDGMMPPRDHPVAVEDFGTTAAEERAGEPLGDRLRRELPEDRGTDAEVPPAVGRLIAPDEGAHPDAEKDLNAKDSGEVGGMTAEEAAMHTDP